VTYCDVWNGRVDDYDVRNGRVEHPANSVEPFPTETSISIIANHKCEIGSQTV